jgi:hypothetical protein
MYLESTPFAVGKPGADRQALGRQAANAAVGYPIVHNLALCGFSNLARNNPKKTERHAAGGGLSW